MTQTRPANAAATIAREQTRGTRLLLTGGIIAGPIYVITTLAQALTRDSFDLRRHSASILANGTLGWIQITNLLLTGLLALGCAIGLRRVGGPLGLSTKWGPRLIGVYGVGLMLASVFRADPALGFPRGTPADYKQVSWHGGLHLMVAGIGFLALIVACFIYARRFAARGERGWTLYSRVSGTLFFAAFAGIASGAGNHALNIAFGCSVVVAWAWLSALAARAARTYVGRA
jgi:Protein of unknown function (DUF998)